MKSFVLFVLASLLISCGSDTTAPPSTDAEVEPTSDLGVDAEVEAVDKFEESTVYDFANQCVTLRGEAGWLKRDADGYGFVAEYDAAEPFFMKASDLGTYLFYDSDGGYLVSDDGPLVRREGLDSDVYLVDDDYVSGAEWELELSQRVSFRYALRHRRTDRMLGSQGLVDGGESEAIEFQSVEGCAEHPEMALNATGMPIRTTYEDGTLFGFVDTHSHILSNFGFGGGGIFHGAPFHRLGVEHAMGDCELFHGPDGRADFLGYGSTSGGEGLDTDTMLALLNTGLLPEPAHATDGWPTFTDWPSQTSATHQTQYYRWLERAWLSGLRIMVQHMVSNEALCQLMADTQFQPVRWGCEDMLNIDRQIVEIYRMQDYIDAQWGGPGEGWFRVVQSPDEARQVVAEGKLAIILGIEVPNLFDCYLVRREDSPVCDREHIEAELDRYRELGIRAIFPNHKYDNAFTPGDGDKGIFELGNFMQTGHWSNYVDECPDINAGFDGGTVQFGGFNEPREDYLGPPPNELPTLSVQPLRDLAPYYQRITEPSLTGDWCQKAGLTAAGRDLIDAMMDRGLIIEVDHLPRRSYVEVYEMLTQADYPAMGTHGRTNDGLIYELGGRSKANFGRCADPSAPGSMAQGFRNRRDQIVAAGGFPAEGFGFDLNGLAGVSNPRFGPDANCAAEQQNPVEYPFTSYDGGVTFEEPTMGERVVDFNTEGMIHIGLVAELIEDARRTGVSNDDLDILFKSAEAYIRVWELGESRAATR